jgi:hypothetical protein
MRIFSLSFFPIILCVVVFVALGVVNLLSPGYFYDELLSAVSSQRLLRGSVYLAQPRELITISLGGMVIPLMHMHYLGTVKSFLLLPFFYFFGDTLGVLRAFTLVCGVVTLVLCYVWVWRNFGKKVAFVTALFLATDPSFILASRYDYGPVAVQNILKVLILLVFYEVWFDRVVGRRKYGALFFLGLLSGLIIWDKLIGAWIVVPIIVLLVYKYKVWPLTRARMAVYFVYASSLVLGMLPVLYYFYSFPFFSKSSVAMREMVGSSGNASIGSRLWGVGMLVFLDLREKLEMLFATLNGVGIVNHILVHPIRGTFLGWVFVVSCIGLVGLVIKSALHNSDRVRISLVLFLLIVLCLFSTPHAIWAHHMLFLWPFPQLFIGLFFVYLLEKCLRFKLILVLLVTLLFLSNVGVLYRFHQVLAHDTKYYWGSADKILLYEYFKKQQFRKIVALDWGISLPIAFISRGTIPIYDLEGIFTDKCRIIEQHTHPGTEVYVLYARNYDRYMEYYKECINPLNRIQYTRHSVSEYLVLTP